MVSVILTVCAVLVPVLFTLVIYRLGLRDGFIFTEGGNIKSYALFGKRRKNERKASGWESIMNYDHKESKK